MKNRLRNLLGATALLGMVSAVSTTTYAQGAVNFDGATYLYAANLADQSPTTTNSIYDGYWFSCTSAQIQSGTILSAYPNPINFQPGFVTTHQMYSGALRLQVYAADLSGTDSILAVSSETLPCDGHYHYIFYTLDTQQQVATHSLDGLQQTWDQARSGIQGNPFYMEANNQKWTLAAQLSSSGQPQTYFKGQLAEVYHHQYPGDYSAALTPGGVQQASARQILQNGVRILFGPLDLGPNCSAVFGPVALPTICARGGAAFFRLNDAGSGSFTVFGTLTDATTDPFDIVP